MGKNRQRVQPHTTLSQTNTAQYQLLVDIFFDLTLLTTTNLVSKQMATPQSTYPMRCYQFQHLKLST
ncbi:hypothetical protein PP707_07750 [Acetobacter pasteurianus]|nr:hypothetical protein [Acetobacter pasteurianus]